MTVRIAFLRAVNVGRRTVGMARLVALLEHLGYDDVWTFVNSGDAVFDAPGSRADLERIIRSMLANELGFEIETFVRTAAELRKVVADDPFPVAEGDTHFVLFLKAVPDAAARREVRGPAAQNVAWKVCASAVR